MRGKNAAHDILKGVCCLEAALPGPVPTIRDAGKAQPNPVTGTYCRAGGTGQVSGDSEFILEASEVASWDNHKFT